MPVKKGCVTEAEAARHKTSTLPAPAGVPVVARGPPDPEVAREYVRQRDDVRRHLIIGVDC